MKPSGSLRFGGLRVTRAVILLLLANVAAWGFVAGTELPPARVVPFPAGTSADASVYSERTLVVGLEIDRDAARLLSYTVKPREYRLVQRLPDPRAHDEDATTQIEVVLTGSAGPRHTRRIDVGPLCLAHDGDEPPHVAGDTIRPHRDAIVVELPEVEGFDRVEIAYFARDRGLRTRRTVGDEMLDRARFDPAAGPLDYRDLAFAVEAGSPAPPSPAASDVLWPEDFADPDVYRVYGDESEGNQRINFVIVPDGYRHADKALMETHAGQLVDYFRSKTPHEEHDPFLNYTLVYAYSVESGTDQCDCSIVKNTAIGTRFPEQNPQCGHSDNRCLSYGGGCDTSGVSNLVAAELRAPFHDETIVMVNTTRYGGCGGLRATYAAGNSSALELAVHETGHSLGGLADEYAYQNGCGSSAGGVNTSLDGSLGAWPEWVPELGLPREGAQYWTQCVFRPTTDCEMRSLFVPFCPVCNQHWSLLTFGHFRVSPTAPVASVSPAPPVSVWVDVPVEFSVETRLSSGPQVQNSFTWTLLSPGELLPVVVATGTPEHTRAFDAPGTYTLALEVVADANFVKPSRYGANVDVASWIVEASTLPPPQEVSAPGAVEPLLFESPSTLVWEDASAAGAFAYNLYRGALTAPAAGSYGVCVQADLSAPSAVDASSPPAGSGWFYLVSGVNPAGEGPLGSTSAGAPRDNVAPCD